MKIKTPILQRLGPIPFWRGEKKCLDGLETIYRKAIAQAQTIVPASADRPSPAPPSAEVSSGTPS